MSGPEAGYRLKLSQGFPSEAREDLSLARWRSAVDNAQWAVERAAKAALALLGPVGRTHHPAIPLRQALADGFFPAAVSDRVIRLIEKAELMGPDLHVQTDYGDEAGGGTPWGLFTESDAAKRSAPPKTLSTLMTWRRCW